MATQKEQIASLKAKCRSLRRECNEWESCLKDMREQRDKASQQRSCIYHKRHKDVFTGEIELCEEEVRIQYKCPLCQFETERPSTKLTERQRSVLTELGIVPVGSG